MTTPTPKIKTRPISNTLLLDQLFPNRFIRAEDLINWKVTSLVVVIDHLQEEEVLPKPGAPPEWKPVLYFRTKTGAVHPQGYLLSAKMDKDTLKAATGAETIGELTGKSIKIYIDSWKGATVLRIDSNPPAVEK